MDARRNLQTPLVLWQAPEQHIRKFRRFSNRDVIEIVINEETYHLLALSLVPGLGVQQIHRLLQSLPSATEVFRLHSSNLKQLGLSSPVRASILSRQALALADEELEKVTRGGISLLSLGDDAYPELLKATYDPAPVLYCTGNIALLSEPAVAIVGSRRCSVYGREVSLKLGRELSGLGLTVVSGLARGIDAQAHRGALQVGGNTMAVLGNGADIVYPKENKALYREIRERGCIVSEFPMGSYPAPQNFPIRNRTISGLCHGTIITEASEFSGSLITARLTLEQNRELWAVPGNITARGSYGPNYLIKQGAHMALEAQDILEELPLTVLGKLERKVDLQAAAEESRHRALCLGTDEKMILKLLPVDDTLHFDELLRISGLDLGRLNQLLFALELENLVQQLPGRQYSRRLL